MLKITNPTASFYELQYLQIKQNFGGNKRRYSRFATIFFLDFSIIKKMKLEFSPFVDQLLQETIYSMLKIEKKISKPKCDNKHINEKPI